MRHFFIEAACGSSVGRIRGNNEDNFFFNGRTLPQENRGLSLVYSVKARTSAEQLFSVFDGMGGEEAGERAAFLAAQTTAARTEDFRRFVMQPRVFLERLCEEMNRNVCEASLQLKSGRMGSTYATLLFVEDSVYASNLGDSRIYRLRNHELLQVSEDHLERFPIPNQKPRLTQYLGVLPDELTLEPFIAKAELQSGDQYLICSDGLTDMLDNVEICTVIKGCASVRKCAAKLIERANRKGGKDNITVVVCKVI